MTRAWSRVPWLGVWGAIALALASPPVRAQTAGVSGVRSTSAAIREMLDDGAWESPTFRDLVRAIASHDGIVYVEDGLCRHGVHSCLLLNVTQASGFRFLKILVDLEGVLAHRKRQDVIATIGHELWHAIEVLGDRTLTSPSAIFQFYGREAATNNSTFETRAAIAAGQRVQDELKHGVTFVWQQVALDVGR